MINVIFNMFEYEILPKQRETYDKYCKIVQWGRKYPTRFAETFLGLTFTDAQKYIFLSSWLPKTVVWLKIGPFYCKVNRKFIKLLETPKAHMPFYERLRK